MASKGRRGAAKTRETTVDGAQLITLDRNAARSKLTNEIDSHVTNAVDMNVIAPAYLSPGDIVSPAARAHAIRGYFDPVAGVAVKEKHELAINMMDYMATLIEPRLVTEKEHPVFGQLGIFARAAIPANTVLGMYGGLLTSNAYADMDHRQTTTCDRSPVDKDRKCRLYIWHTSMREASVARLTNKEAKAELMKLQYKGNRANITSDVGFEILGTHRGGNMLRFINGFQGIAKHDNVVVLTVWWRGAPRIVYMTRLDIPKGNELLVDYGPEHTFDAEDISAETGIAAEEPDNDEFIVTKITAHRRLEGAEREEQGSPYAFLVTWGDGAETWTPGHNLVEYEPSDPVNPYIFNSQFLAYLRSKRIDPALFIHDETKEGPLTDDDDDDGDDNDDDDTPDLTPMKKKGKEKEKKEEPAEVRVVKIDDMHYKGAADGYEFRVHWSDGTIEWTPVANLVDEDPDSAGEYIYTKALLTYLNARGIKNYTDVVKKHVFPVAVLAHSGVKKLRFDIHMSDAKKIKGVGLDQLVDIVIDSEGHRTARYKIPLRHYVSQHRADKEFMRLLKAESSALVQ